MGQTRVRHAKRASSTHGNTIRNRLSWDAEGMPSCRVNLINGFVGTVTRNTQMMRSKRRDQIAIRVERIEM